MDNLYFILVSLNFFKKNTIKKESAKWRRTNDEH